MEKISFSVENIKTINENPDSNFAILSLDFFASGMNRHEMYVSEETLLRTADTIKNCPLIWKYDRERDDAYTHDDEEIPCGFVPDSSMVKTKKLKDGRIMLSAIAYVWKRYTGELLNIFRRDGGKKSISVEISAYELEDKGGISELLDFKYEGITVLGERVTPAIPLANATVLSFSEIKKEYDKAVEEEFSDTKAPDGVDMQIPEEVKNNARKGLELAKEDAKGATSVNLSIGHYLIDNDEISLEKAEYIVGYFSNHKNNSTQRELSSSENIANLLFGGNDCKEWAKTIISELKEKEEENMAKEIKEITFPYKSKEDVNPALKGITPPVSLSQANEIAKQADTIGSDNKKNGWAIAISSFKKTHVVKDGKWVKKQNMSAEEVFSDNKTEEENPSAIIINSMQDGEQEKQEVYLDKETLRKEEENMGKENMEKEKEEEVKEEEVKEEAVKEEEEMAEPKAEEKKEEKKEVKEEKKEEKEEEMASPEPSEKDAPVQEEAETGKMEMAVSKVLKLCKLQAPLYQEMENKYGEKIIRLFETFALDVSEGTFDFASIFSKFMTSFVKESNAQIFKMQSDYDICFEELEELRKFKTTSEQEKLDFEVNTVLSEAYESGMSKEDIAAFREEAKSFSLDRIDAFKNMVKAKAFVYLSSHKRNDKQQEFTKIGLPFTEEKPQVETLWE